MISSTKNEQVKTVIELKKKAKARNEAKLFVVEGVRMVSELPKERTEKLYVSESFLKNPDNEKFLCAYPKYEAVTDPVFAAMSDTQTPQGVLALVRQYEYGIDDVLNAEGKAHLMILENLQDPGNLGTIMRTAEGAGVDAVIMSKDTVDIYNPKTIRATMGSVYRVPFVYVEDIIGLVHYLYRRNIHTYAAHLKGAHDYTDENYTAGTAFLIGNEGNGLTDACADAAEKYIKIPMLGKLESLNAGVAAALLMYETLRQRRK